MSILKTITLGAVLTLAVGCGASVQSTPVTPVPATPEEVADMTAKIQGKWQAKTIQDQGKPPEPFSGGTMVLAFGPGGQLGAAIEVEGNFVMAYRDAASIKKDFTYSFDGRNLKTSFAYIPDARVESLTATELKLFNYGMSQTLTLEKK